EWSTTPTITLDMAVSRDFGEVEADQQVLTLSTYETFYPEKRPFFLEGADLFAAPIQVLYTRRIGRAPDAPALPDGELARALPDPARLWTAAKLTGTAGGTHVGALAGLTGTDRRATAASLGTHEGARGEMLGGPDRIAEPASAYTALRLRKGLGSNGYVGMFATGVTRFEGHDYPVIGTDMMCPDGSVVAFGSRCTHDAYIGG